MRGQPIFANRRIVAVTLLGFSSGLPLALTNTTLQAWFTQAGISVITIGMLSLIGLPYVWKFLWAPIIDKLVPPFLGRRRGWIALMQLSLALALFLLAQLNPLGQSSWIAMLALVVAFLSASQDIAVDAYRTDILLPKERGISAAFFIFAYRIAMLVSGGLALIFADYLGWRFTYELMAILLVGLVAITYFSPEIPGSIKPPQNFMAAVVEPFKDLGHRDGFVIILLFIVFYKIGDALALSLMSNFLLRGLGFSLTDVGVAYKTVGLIATLLGAFVGGGLLYRLGLYSSLLYFGIAQAFSNLMFMLLAIVGKNYLLMTGSIFIEHFCSGMSTAALLAFMMELCHQQYSATQFACLSALSAVGRIISGPIAGVMVTSLGWVSFYGWTFIVCFPGLALLVMLRRRVVFHAQAISQA